MLSGKSIVFTGTLELKRADAKARAEAAGATVAGDVSGKTTLVVSGKDGGAKLEKAQAKGIEIWDEAAFTAALSSGGSSTASGKKKAEPSANEGPPAKKGKTNAAAPAPAPAPAATGAPTSATSGSGGGRKPDRSVPADGGVFKVHEDYDVKLMQTNIGGGQNNNKFYIIQVLQDQAGSYFAWNRWGRLGEEGQHKLEPHGSAEAAISSFQKKFKDKTKNPWISGAPASAFVKHEGKYQLVEVEDGDGGDGALGKLTADQISKGQSVLERIKAALNGDGGSIAALSSQFYSLIPTTSGRVAPPPIGDMGILAEKEHQLDFWLRMGFEDMQVVVLDNPLEKMYELAVPPTLHAAAATISDKGSIAQSQARGKELEKAQAGKPKKKMGGELYASIVLYTGNSIYRSLNTALREKHAQVPRYLSYLRLFFEAMAMMPKASTTLWRGIAADLYDQYEEGKVITWWSVSSCTSDENVARGFMAQLGGSASLITLKCKTAMDITPLSMYSNEKESLLAPGTMLKVLSRKRVGKIAEILVEEVGSALD